MELNGFWGKIQNFQIGVLDKKEHTSTTRKRSTRYESGKTTTRPRPPPVEYARVEQLNCTKEL
jgi:hypothetical protein